MISHLGPQLGLADGVALAEKLDETGGCSFVFTGDGGASEGDFHEAVNGLPCGNFLSSLALKTTLRGLSTPSEQQFKCAHFTDKAIGYGIPKEDAIRRDGNDLLTCTTKWPDLLNLYERDLGLSY